MSMLDGLSFFVYETALLNLSPTAKNGNIGPKEIALEIVFFEWMCTDSISNYLCSGYKM